MRIEADDQVIEVQEAIRICADPETGMASMPDVVAICALSRMTRQNAYNVINRWNHQCWNRVGESIELIRVRGRE